MNDKSFVKLYRKFDDWEWYSDTPVKVVFLHLLIKATFKDINFKGTKIEAGTVITGRELLSKETNLSVQQIRTALNKLKSTNEVTIKSTNKGTLIYLVNWRKYQSNDEFSNQQNNQNINFPVTNNQPTNNQQVTTKEEGIELKKVKNDKKKDIYGTYANVFLSVAEFEKLNQDFPDIQIRINRLSEYIESTGKKYKSHNATIRMWANRDSEHKSVNEKKQVLPDYMGEIQQVKTEEVSEEEKQRLFEMLQEVSR